MNWSFSFKAFAGMPRHALITAAMLSCLSAVAVADSQLSATCCGSDYDGTRNNKLHNTASRLCGDTLPKFEASTTCSDGWCTLLTLLAANFSIRPCLISHRVVTGKADSLCHFLHVSWSVTHISITNPLSATSQHPHRIPFSTRILAYLQQHCPLVSPIHHPIRVQQHHSTCPSHPC